DPGLSLVSRGRRAAVQASFRASRCQAHDVSVFGGGNADTSTPDMAEVVVITGGSAGVGRAVAQRFARRGCSIGLIARGQERLDAAATEVDKMGGRGLALPYDVADPAAVERAADRAEAEFGPVDIW